MAIVYWHDGAVVDLEDVRSREERKFLRVELIDGRGAHRGGCGLADCLRSFDGNRRQAPEQLVELVVDDTAGDAVEGTKMTLTRGLR